MNEVKQHRAEATEIVVLSDNALRHVEKYLQQKNHKGIRLSVKKTGCSGLSYVVDYVDDPKEGDITLSILNKQYLICIDKASYPYLKGMHMDYIKEGLGHKFVFQNPNQTGQCGCGESFTVD